MPATFSLPPWVSDPDIHHGTCVTHAPWCMPGSLNSGFLWSWWRGKHSRHSRRMRNPQYYVSGKRPIVSGPHCVECQSIHSDPSLDMLNRLHVSQQTTTLLWLWLRFRRIIHSHLLKYHLPITYFSVIKSFRKFSQSMAVSLPCSIQNFKTIRQLKRMSWTNEISRDLSLRWVSNGIAIFYTWHEIEK